MNVVRFILNNSNMKINRSRSDFLADRIVQAGTEPTLLAFIEKLSKLMDSDLGQLYTASGMEFLRVSGNELESMSILQWIREFSGVAAMIAALPKIEMVKEACESIEVKLYQPGSGLVRDRGSFDINIKITALAPLCHGSDTKAGNATLFRRMDILTEDGSLIKMPFYAGNAFRGEMRDLLADHFLESIGIVPNRTKPPVALWFFYCLYSGGALEDDSKAAKMIGAELGGNGAIKAEGIYRFRDTLPALSLIGCALGNRILPGRVSFIDYLPACLECGNGSMTSSQLMGWTYITRREDYEGHEAGENKSMIANTECLKLGTMLDGGVNMFHHISDLEKSALGCGLNLMIRRGHIGAESSRGHGKVKIEIENIPDETMYLEFLKINKDQILEYLNQLGALDASENGLKPLKEPIKVKDSRKKVSKSAETSDAADDGADNEPELEPVGVIDNASSLFNQSSDN
jgi:hypothetical protein